jgi:hypothetical protein
MNWQGLAYMKNNELIRFNYPTGSLMVLYAENDGILVEKLKEENVIDGFVLFEILLERFIGKETKKRNNEEIIELFKQKDNGIFTGWFPYPAMVKLSDITYFVLDYPIDLDCTSWLCKLTNQTLTENLLRERGYFSDVPFEEFYINELIQKEKIDITKIPRTWGRKDWHEEWDILMLANTLSSLDKQSKAFNEGRKLINAVIENGLLLETYSEYYLPIETYYALLLFYDHIGDFLSPKAKKIVKEGTKKISIPVLATNKPIFGWVGQGEKIEGMYYYLYSNIRLVPLLLKAVEVIL